MSHEVRLEIYVGVFYYGFYFRTCQQRTGS